jgi:hypothetical protein
MNAKTVRSVCLVVIPVIVGIVISVNKFLSTMPSGAVLGTYFSDEDQWSSYAWIMHKTIIGSESWENFVGYYNGYWHAFNFLMPVMMALMMFLIPQTYIQFVFNSIFFAASLFMVWKICHLFNIDVRTCAVWVSSYGVMMTSVALRYGDTFLDFVLMLYFYTFVSWMKGRQEERKVNLEWTLLAGILMLFTREAAWLMILFPTCTILVSFHFTDNKRKIKDLLLISFYTAFFPGVILLGYLDITNSWHLVLTSFYELNLPNPDYTPGTIIIYFFLTFGIAPVVLFTAKPRLEYLPFYVFLILFVVKQLIFSTIGYFPYYLQGCVFAFAVLQSANRPNLVIPSVVINTTLAIIVTVI